MADIEFYTVSTNVEAEIVKKDGKNITVSAKSNIDGKFTLLVAVYNAEGELLEVVTKPVSLIEETTEEFSITTTKDGDVTVFTWGDNMLPVGDKISA